MNGPLEKVMSGSADAFALLHRPHSDAPETVDVLTADVTRPARLADVPLLRNNSGGHDALVLIPYRQIAERGFAAHDDGAPLLVMTVTGQETIPVEDVWQRVADTAPSIIHNGHFDISDDEYADIVRTVVDEEIGTGSGSNFVIRRSFIADIDDYSTRTALALFRRLLDREQGAYWTFLIHTGDRTLLGATPERHVSLVDGTVTMNPISGTYRYPDSGPTLDGVAGFLADNKEIDELHMVLDEELKMMARICAPGVRVVGPRLREMARLAHTEYFIEGRSTRDVRDILRETMFAPTVVGSPVESAARVIHRRERTGRGYYSGVAALIGRDAEGQRSLDSAILIRTAEVSPHGRATVGVGATLVRHSDPDAEVAETHAKIAGLRAALLVRASLAEHPSVDTALRRRAQGIAPFWRRHTDPPRQAAGLAGVRAVVVDAEDSFTAMIAHQLGSLGLTVTVMKAGESLSLNGIDLILLGPGPGDPRSAEPKLAHLRSTVDRLLVRSHPFIAVCLSHQVLAIRLGLALRRRDIPAQGEQREITLFGRRERVGFYNTYAAVSDEDKIDAGPLGPVEVSRDQATGEVHALRGSFFASMQFHAESVLTMDGPRVLATAIAGVLGR